MKKIVLLLTYVCSALFSFAQYDSYQNTVWAFGLQAGVDFSSGTPVPIVTSITANEGSASVSNNAGMLFYTEGNIVYNRLGTVMPGGSAIAPFMFTPSTSQGAVIVPFVNDTDKYYIFSLEAQEGGGGHLVYSIVDMTLDGGLGDLVAGSVGIILDSGMSEKMISVRGDNCDIWVIVHKQDIPKFYAYNITSSGINTVPVISNVGTFSGPNCYEVGVMKCSHDRQKLVTTTKLAGTPTYGVELYDLNPATGVVSNCKVLALNPMFDDPYGAEFSADNTKLYTTGDGVLQWDISLPSLAAIIASKTMVCSLTTITDLRLGPDARIYFNSSSTNFLDRINFPNNAGLGCGCTPNAVSLAPSTKRYGLPNQVWSVQGVTVTGNKSVCVGTTTTLAVGWPSASWHTRNPSVANITSAGVLTAVAPGTAIISYTAGQICGGSTVVTVYPNPDPITGPVTVCTGQTITLGNPTPGGTWSVASGVATINATTGVLTGVTAGFVNITYTAPPGVCSAFRTDTVKPCITLVDRTNTNNPIELYPNPATNEITIKSEQSAFTSFSIYNAVGQVVATHEITGSEISVSVKTFPPGEYQVIFKNEGLREMIRFVKW